MILTQNVKMSDFNKAELFFYLGLSNEKTGDIKAADSYFSKAARDTFFRRLTFVNESKSNLFWSTLLDAIVFMLIFLLLDYTSRIIYRYIGNIFRTKK